MSCPSVGIMSYQSVGIMSYQLWVIRVLE